jgi:hypothetical protein
MFKQGLGYMAQTQIQTQTESQTPKTHTRSELLKTLRKMMDVSDFKIMIVYLNNVVRDVLNNGYTAALNPFVEVAAVWITDEEKNHKGEPIHVITVHVLYLNKIMMRYKFASDPRTDRIIDAGVFFRVFCDKSHPM